jgi:hypothetical protein
MKEELRDRIIASAREVAERLGKSDMTCAEFVRESEFTRHQVYTAFPEGGWTTVLQAANLAVRPQDSPLSDSDLLEEFHRVVSIVGKIPTWRVFQDKAQISADTIRRRFGGIQGTLKKYRQWLETNQPESSTLALLATKSKHEVPPPPEATVSKLAGPAQWRKSSGPEFGSPLSFRGLTHAPINEQGVVYLFGMVSFELGFVVEAIQSSFPDCEAKRCIDPKRNRWQRVRIEFEYESSNFQAHGHDPSGCDLIVCWEHDWPASPLEVLELRTVIDELGG